jgi:hypothetical protein
MRLLPAIRLSIWDDSSTSPRTAIIDQSGFYAVIYLGSLGEMLRRASVMTVTARPS